MGRVRSPAAGFRQTPAYLLPSPSAVPPAAPSGHATAAAWGWCQQVVCGVWWFLPWREYEFFGTDYQTA